MKAGHVLSSILFLCAVGAPSAHALCLPAACYRIEARPLGGRPVNYAPAGQPALAAQYQGLLLEIEISAALREGCADPLDLEHEWLSDDKIPTRIKAFVHNPAGKCPAYLMPEQLTASVTKQCCDGDPNVPCLLGTSQILKNVRSAGHSW